MQFSDVFVVLSFQMFEAKKSVQGREVNRIHNFLAARLRGVRASWNKETRARESKGELQKVHFQ
jgi:hypothetical protein